MPALLEIRFDAQDLEIKGLRVLAGDRIETWVVVPEQPILIGRATGVHVRVPESTLTKRHAEIQPGFTIRDLGSEHGTFVNGTRLTEPHRLVEGDVIGLGGPATARFHDVIPRYVCTNAERMLMGAGPVYAKWLEDHGDPVRAAFVRERELLAKLKPGRELDEQLKRCTESIDSVDLGWRFDLVRNTKYQAPS